ncbi:MAG: hypothetical protein WCO00_02780 [Rhodospirillaceae bacterium]
MREFRCLVFSDQEVITAYVERLRRLREVLPSGTIRGVEYRTVETGEVHSTITVVSDSGECHRLEIRAVEMAASLVDFCLNRKIPIPAASRKWVEVITAGEMILLMTVAEKKARAFRPRRLPVLK